MTVKEFLKQTYKQYNTEQKDINTFYSLIRPHIICNDGFRISVQASSFNYCTPRENLSDGEYETVELGMPSMEDDLIKEYAENKSNYTNTIYGFVPMEIVEELILKHDGINCKETSGING